MDYGFNKGALNKNIPLGILQLPKHKLKVFLDGYMSGDGCNIKHSSIYQATTISRELAESLVLAVQKVYGIGCRIYYTKRPKTTIIEDREVNQSDTYMIRFDINPKNPRYLVDDGCVWYPIKKILNTNTTQVIYNLTVDEDHTYTANNCYVGNCQDFSLAGKQAGGDIGSGTRSSLMYETVRIVGKLRPKYVVWENVKNLLGKKHKHNFDAYIDTMNILGYNSYYQVLNAKDYGIPQNRERVYTISIRKDIDTQDLMFPPKEELKLRLKDMLEEQVDEKYYLSDKLISGLVRQEALKHKPNFIEDKDVVNTIDTKVGDNTHFSPYLREQETSKCVRLGGIFDTETSKHQAGSIYDKEGISPTLDVMQGGYRQPSIIEDDVSNIPLKRGYSVDVKAEQESTSDIDIVGNYSKSDYNATPIVGKNGIAPTVRENHGQVTGIVINEKSSDSVPPEIITHDITQSVKVRKYPVDVENLKLVLGNAKQTANLSNKDIAEKLNLPQTQVEHYFRKDDCFAIPSENVWFDLKELLNIKTDEFDKSIMIFEIKENNFDSSNRVYATEGIAPTLDTGDNKKIIEYKGKEVELPAIAASRGRNPDNPSSRVPGEHLEQTLEVNVNGTSNTLTSVPKDNYVLCTADQPRVVVGDNNVEVESYPTIIQKCGDRGTNNYSKSDMSYTIPSNPMSDRGQLLVESKVDLNALTTNYKRIKQLSENTDFNENDTLFMDIYNQKSIVEEAGTLKAGMDHQQGNIIYNPVRIRKLTPKECWRLMGFDDEDFDKARIELNNVYHKGRDMSNSQLYKQAGNSIVVNVLEQIFKNLFKID